MSALTQLHKPMGTQYSTTAQLHPRCQAQCVMCRKASAVEHMVVDALLAAEPVVRLAEKTEDSREFAKLDDTILRVRSWLCEADMTPFPAYMRLCQLTQVASGCLCPQALDYVWVRCTQYTRVQCNKLMRLTVHVVLK